MIDRRNLNFGNMNWNVLQSSQLYVLAMSNLIASTPYLRKIRLLFFKMEWIFPILLSRHQQHLILQ